MRTFYALAVVLMSFSSGHVFPGVMSGVLALLALLALLMYSLSTQDEILRGIEDEIDGVIEDMIDRERQ